MRNYVTDKKYRNVGVGRGAPTLSYLTLVLNSRTYRCNENFFSFLKKLHKGVTPLIPNMA